MVLSEQAVRQTLFYADTLADTLLNAMATPQSRMEQNKAGNATCHAKETRRLTVVVLEQCRYSKLDCAGFCHHKLIAVVHSTLKAAAKSKRSIHSQLSH